MFQAQYASRNKGKFATFDQLVESAGLDEAYRGAEPVVNGYKFSMNIVEPSSSTPGSYSINANPQISTGITATGRRYFYTDSSLGTIKATEENRPATADDPSI